MSIMRVPQYLLNLSRLFFLFSLILLSSQCKDGAKKEGDQVSASEESDRNTEKEIKVYPVSHATMVLQYGDIDIYIDPVGPVDQYSGYPSPDLILVTDIHGDHFNLETLSGLKTENAKIVMPQAVADEMPDSFTPQIDVLNNGESKERFEILIEAIPMYNLREEALNFHQKGRGNGYVLNIGGQRAYISGDTEDIPEMRSLKDIDMAFVCMNLPYTMTVESAADAVLEFKPRKVYPYHYRGNPDVSDVARFKEVIYTGNPDLEVVQLDWYPNMPY